MTIDSTSLKIVFIYLGKKIPNYVIKNAVRTAELFDLKILLFIDEQADVPQNLTLNPLLEVRAISSIMSKERQKLGHSATFRNEFWNHTFNRLMILRGIHRELGEHMRILHVEADMLLLPSFPFETALGNKLKWFRYNDVGDVASLLFSPSLSETEWLHSKLLQEVQKDPFLTDMSALKRIREKNAQRIDIFEDIFEDEARDSTLNIFDGLSLGMWLCGVDPRNTYGFHVIHENGEYKLTQNRSLIDTLSEGELLLDNGRLLFSRRDRVQEIHCLHVHSKCEELFHTGNDEKLLKFVHFSKNPSPKIIEFQFKLLHRLFKENLQSGTFLRYFHHFLKFILNAFRPHSIRIITNFKFSIWRKSFK